VVKVGVKIKSAEFGREEKRRERFFKARTSL
jgi:hypothetical protein